MFRLTACLCIWLIGWLISIELGDYSFTFFAMLPDKFLDVLRLPPTEPCVQPHAGKRRILVCHVPGNRILFKKSLPFLLGFFLLTELFFQFRKKFIGIKI